MSHASIRPDGGIAAQAIVCAAPHLGPYREESLPNLVGQLEIWRERIFAEQLSLLMVQERLRQRPTFSQGNSCESCPEIPATHSTPAPSGFPRPPKLVGHPTGVGLAKPIHEQIDPAPAEQRLSAPNYQSFNSFVGGWFGYSNS
jgi:hypothetical protein